MRKEIEDSETLTRQQDNVIQKLEEKLEIARSVADNVSTTDVSQQDQFNNITAIRNLESELFKANMEIRKLEAQSEMLRDTLMEAVKKFDTLNQTASLSNPCRYDPPWTIVCQHLSTHKSTSWSTHVHGSTI